MDEERIIIIGGGIAGLAAGCYAQINGFRSTVLEMHFLPGGLCTSWRRGGYVFDGSLRSLAGAGKGSNARQLWDELGVLDDTPIHYFDNFLAYEGQDGRVLNLFTNIDRLESHLLELAPADRRVIHRFAQDLRAFAKVDMPLDMTPSTPLENLEIGQAVIPAAIPMARWMNVSINEYASRFKDPFIREAIPNFFQFSPPDFPVMVMMMGYADMHNHESGYPLGGSLQFSQRLEQRYRELGGEVRYRTRVDQILTRQGRAVGVRLADGSRLSADHVISAADGRATIYDLLGGKFIDDTIKEHYYHLPRSRSILQISLGVDRDLSNEPPMINFPLPTPINLAGVPHDRLVVKHYCFDPGMAPAGKSAVTLWCEADYEFWMKRKDDEAAYAAAENQLLEQIITALDARFPGMAEQVQVSDVATPLTYERYTGNWRGAFAGWAISSRKVQMMIASGMPKTLPGLDHFYRIGHWVEPGGNVQLSAASGRDVIKDICLEEKREFRTSPAGG